MTPERKQQLMQEAAQALRSQWGEVRPGALQALIDDLRTRAVEGEPPSIKAVVAEVMGGPHSQSLFQSAEAGRQEPAIKQGADRGRDAELDR